MNFKAILGVLLLLLGVVGTFLVMFGDGETVDFTRHAVTMVLGWIMLQDVKLDEIKERL